MSEHARGGDDANGGTGDGTAPGPKPGRKKKEKALKTGGNVKVPVPSSLCLRADVSIFHARGAKEERQRELG
jgi:hypothetical protein